MICLLFLLCFIVTSLASEPKTACTQFEYMDNLLTKMIKQEFTYNQLKEDMLALRTNVIDELKQFKTMVDTNTNLMKKHIEDFQILEDSLQTKVKDGLDEIRYSQNKTDNELTEAVKKMRDDIKEEMGAFKTAVRMDFETMTKEFKTTTENDTNQIKTLVQEFQKMKEASVAENVAFLSKDVSVTTPSSGQTFIFTTTVINEGEGYNNGTGHFKAPVGGMYKFHIQICLNTGSSNYIYFHVMADNKHILGGFFRDRDTFKCYTADVLVRLQRGNEVWIKCYSCSGTMWQDYTAWNTFSGHRLHA